MNVLITGATGFIGRHITQELAKKKDINLFCLVRNDKKAQRLEHLGVKFIYANITQKHTLTKILRHNIDIIIHCAAVVNADKKLLHETNVLGTQNICELAQNLNVERFIYFSSVSVISGNPDIPLKEDLPYKATSEYGESKIEAEKIVLMYRRRGLKTAILRPCMVYGPDEPHLLKTLLSLIKLRLLFTLDEGKKKLHLVYVGNVVAAVVDGLKKDEFLEGSFFVADEDVLTVKEILDIISREIKAPRAWNLPPIFKPILFKIPKIGGKAKFFLKDRVYSIQHLKEAEFKWPYKTREAFAQSIKTYISNKKSK
jgi:nucleoside-diphosphate-sugar epimerase